MRIVKCSMLQTQRYYCINYLIIHINNYMFRPWTLAIIRLYDGNLYLARYKFSYIFGCDLISYGPVLFRLWICVLMVLARESIFRLSYFSGFFLFVVILLTIKLNCTFRRIGLLSFYVLCFFESRLIPPLFLILGWGTNLSGFRLVFIYCFTLC
jgi:NADH-ubiquinone oxidoreductase chain 4